MIAEFQWFFGFRKMIGLTSAPSTRAGFQSHLETPHMNVKILSEDWPFAVRRVLTVHLDNSVHIYMDPTTLAARTLLHNKDNHLKYDRGVAWRHRCAHQAAHFRKMESSGIIDRSYRDRCHPRAAPHIGWEYGY